jgi:hypothetical protein
MPMIWVSPLRTIVSCPVRSTFLRPNTSQGATQPVATDVYKMPQGQPWSELLTDTQLLVQC